MTIYIIGHEQKDCKHAAVMTAICNEIPLYGAKLSVPPAKPLKVLIREQQRWRTDTGVTGFYPKGRSENEGEGSSKDANNGGRSREEDSPAKEDNGMGQEQTAQGADL